MATLSIDLELRNGQVVVQGLRGVEAAAGAAKEKSEGLLGSLGRIGLARQGIDTITGGLASLAQTLGEAERHDAAMSGLGNALRDVERATAGAVTAEQAYRVQQQLTQAGLTVTSEQLAAITRRARDYARATGTDLMQSLDQLTGALRSGEAGGLRPFGVQLREGTDRMTAFTTATQSFTDAQRGVPPAARAASEELTALNRSITTLIGNAALAITRFLRLQEVMSGLNDPFNEQGRAAQVDRQAQLGAQMQRDTARTQIANALTGALRSGNVTVAQNDLLSDVSRQMSPGAAMQMAALIRAGRIDEATRAAGLFNASGNVGAEISITGSGAPAAARSGGGGARRPRQTVEQLSAGFGSYQRPDTDTSFLDDLARGQSQSTALDPGAVGADAIRRQEQQERADRDRERRTETDNLRTQQREMNDVGRQMNRSFEGIFGANRTLAQNFASTMRGAFDTATNSFKSHLSALITGRESFGEALRGFTHEVMLDLAVQSAPKAIFELAEGFAALGMTFGAPNPKAISHFTSAAMFGGLALGGGLIAAATAPQAGAVPGGAGGQTTPPRSNGVSGRSSESGGGGNVTHVYNFQSAVITREDSQDVVRRTANQAAWRGQVYEVDRQASRRRAP